MSKEYRTHFVVGLSAGLLGVVSLAALWHLLGLDNPDAFQGAGYELSNYFYSCLSVPFVVMFILGSSILGWGSHGKGLDTGRARSSRWHALAADVHPGALGMILPLPATLFVEVLKDPTSHNLFPFEILVFWIPALLIAFLGASLGWLVRTFALRDQATD